MKQLFLQWKKEKDREAPLGRHHNDNVADNIHALMLIVSGSLRRSRICSLKVSPPRHLSTDSNIRVENPHKHKLKAIKVSITCELYNKIHYYHESLHNNTLRKTQCHFCGTSAKNAQTDSSHKKTSDKPKLRDILKNINSWSVFFKNGKQRQGKTEELLGRD